MLVTIRNIARSWGVAPWIVAGEQPTEAVVSRWATREMVFARIGVP